MDKDRLIIIYCLPEMLLPEQEMVDSLEEKGIHAEVTHDQLSLNNLIKNNRDSSVILAVHYLSVINQDHSHWYDLYRSFLQRIVLSWPDLTGRFVMITPPIEDTPGFAGWGNIVGAYIREPFEVTEFVTMVERMESSVTDPTNDSKYKL